MYQLKIIFMAMLLVTTSGCANWPPKGQGGMEEHRLNQLQDRPIDPDHELHFARDLSRRHLDTLVLSGAEICFPATVKTARIRGDRISRALAGGLDYDAANDLIIQRDQLALLERRLNYVKQQGSCLNTSYTTVNLTQTVDPQTQLDSSEQINNAAKLTHAEPVDTTDQIQYILKLLNNNNQFAVDSFQLNPRYIGHLAEAAVLLRGYPEYKLQLTGHADSKGSDANNQQLSLERAKQVARYLQIFGLKTSSIMINGKGESAPLFPGNEEHIRLVNRRVSIKLINMAAPTELTQL